MPKIIVTKAFKFAHFGYQVEDFEVSHEPRETTQEVVDVLKDEGFFDVVNEVPPAPALAPEPALAPAPAPDAKAAAAPEPTPALAPVPPPSEKAKG